MAILLFYGWVIFLCVCSSSCCLAAKSCPTLCDPMDCSPPGSSVHGISQTRILAWVPVSHFYPLICWWILTLFIMLVWTLECMYFFELEILSFQNIYPGVGLLDHMVALLLVFWETSILFFIIAVPIYIPISLIFSVYLRSHQNLKSFQDPTLSDLPLYPVF